MYVDDDICYHGKAFYTASKQHAIVMHKYYMYTIYVVIFEWQYLWKFQKL